MKLFVNALCLTLLTCSFLEADDGFLSLFDGKTLEGWRAAHGDNPNDYGPFSVNRDENAICVYSDAKAGSKQNSDCLYTDAEFSHFILKLEYKWLEKRFHPRSDWDRDAGLLFHIHGDLSKVWPLSIEMQIGESPGDKMGSWNSRFHTGDLFVLGKKLRAKTPRRDGIYHPEGKQVKGRSVRTRLGVETPKGQWNEIEIHVQGSEKATYMLNGEVVMELFEFEQLGDDGDSVPLDKGRIGLQAEWAELMYRNIRIKNLASQGERSDENQASF